MNIDAPVEPSGDSEIERRQTQHSYQSQITVKVYNFATIWNLEVSDYQILISADR